MSALDADVIKTYVELGMGVGIVNDVAYDKERDYRLSQLKTGIFGLNTTWIAVRKGHLLRGYGYEFISLCSPEADIKQLKKWLTQTSKIKFIKQKRDFSRFCSNNYQL